MTIEFCYSTYHLCRSEGTHTNKNFYYDQIDIKIQSLKECEGLNLGSQLISSQKYYIFKRLFSERSRKKEC